MGRQMRFHTAYSIHAKAFLWPERGGPRTVVLDALIARATSFRPATGGRKNGTDDDCWCTRKTAPGFVTTSLNCRVEDVADLRQVPFEAMVSSLHSEGG